MNSEVNTSSAQSWIVENISSLISSNQDDENDCTLTMPNENKNSSGRHTKEPTTVNLIDKCDGDSEVETARTLVSDDLLPERIPKPPFSPELITENAKRVDQFNFLNTNLQSNIQNQRPNQIDELRPTDFENLAPLKPFPSSSSFYDDLNLEDCPNKNNNKFLSSFMHMPSLQPLPMMSLNNNNQAGTRDSYFGFANPDEFSDSTTTKKKKLTSYSLSSSNLPTVSVTYSKSHNNSSLSVFNDNSEDLSKNLSQSSYSTSLNSMSSGPCISTSSSYNSNLSNCFMNSGNDFQQVDMNYNNQQHQLNSQASVNYEKLHDMLINASEDSSVNDNGLGLKNQNWDLSTAASHYNNAVCPECKNPDDLTVCDHCSGIFCKECYEIHLRDIFNTVNSRITNIENRGTQIQNAKNSLKAEEQTVLKKTLNRMDSIQNQIFSLWHERKMILINEIHNFYKKKSHYIELAEFRTKTTYSECMDVKRKMKDIEKALLCVSYDKMNLYREFRQLDDELYSIENTLNNSFAEFNIQTQAPSGLDKLELKYHEIDYMETFKKILNSVYFIAKNEIDETFLNENNLQSNIISVSDIFGKPVLQLDNSELENLVTIGDLKEIASKKLMVAKNLISFIEKVTLASLPDSSHLWIKKAKLSITGLGIKSNEEAKKNPFGKLSGPAKENIEFYLTFKFDQAQVRN